MRDSANDPKIVTFENAPKQLISKILAADRKAKRDELEVLFQKHIVGKKLERHILSFFKDRELCRLIALEIYRSNVYVRHRQRTLILKQLAKLTGLHYKTVKLWVDTNFEENGEVCSRI